jgi:hypothetical protein
MTDQPGPRVRFARRFVAKIPDHPDIHGIEFPDSRRIIADVEDIGLTAFLTVDIITRDYDGAVIHWADEDTHPAPSVQCPAPEEQP